MAPSRQISRILGPTLMALGATEAFNMDIYAAQSAPVVYLNGTILLVAGLAIVQAHNVWEKGWKVLVTLAGWLLLAAGLFRMVDPKAPQLGEGPATYGVLALLFLAGTVLTFKGYSKSS